MEIKAAKEIRGTVEVPPSYDLLVLATSVAIVSRAPVVITRGPDSPAALAWAETLKDHLSITIDNGSWRCVPVTEAPARIAFPDAGIPFRDLIVPLLLGAGKNIVFPSVSQDRIDSWKSAVQKMGYDIEVTGEGERAISLSGEGSSALSDDPLTVDEIYPLLGVALGKGQRFEVRSSTPFSDPIRPLLGALGYDFAVHSTLKVEDDPIKKRLRFLQKGRKNDEAPTFTVSGDFSQRPDQEVTITVPGDFAFVSILVAAKSLVQKGNLIIGNAPLESWANHTLDFVRKMGCRPGIQESGETTFGSVGLIQLQSFTLGNRKTVCSPLPQFISHLPGMVVTACFAQGQSVFRGLEDLRRDSPDTIQQIVTYLSSLGARHGEMPDGIVIEGARQFDGFDAQQPTNAVLDAAFAIAGLKCIGTTAIPDHYILQRWPNFNDVLASICDFKS